MKKAFVAGFPISHSKSPSIHGFWLKEFGLEGSYEALEVSPQDFERFLIEFAAEGYCGGNVTIPHKEVAFRNITSLDDAAEAIGAVNTIWIEDGEIFGGNTDAYGFLANLDASQPRWRKGTSALVIGAGGASRAIIYGLKKSGFNSIHIANRTLSRAEALSEEFGSCCHAHELSNMVDLARSVDLVVNTSSLGMTGQENLDLRFVSQLPDQAIVTDIVYNPLITPLLAEAQSRNLSIVDGLGMLLHQAVPGFEKWFGVRPEVTTELRNRVLEVS